jgi:hypothetical protein
VTGFHVANWIAVPVMTTLSLGVEQQGHDDVSPEQPRYRER